MASGLSSPMCLLILKAKYSVTFVSTKDQNLSLAPRVMPLEPASGEGAGPPGGKEPPVRPGRVRTHKVAQEQLGEKRMLAQIQENSTTPAGGRGGHKLIPSLGVKGQQGSRAMEMSQTLAPEHAP